MVKKFFVIVIALVVSSGLIYGADSYTSAAVTSDAKVKVVDSRDALIAVEQDGQNITIRNNMATTIALSAYVGAGRQNHIWNENKNLGPGKSLSFIVNQGSEPCIVFHARWNGGEANIKHFFDYNK